MSRLVAGTLLLPDQSPFSSADIYFVAKRNEATAIVEGVTAKFTTGTNGSYSQEIVSGFYAVSVSYTPIDGAATRRASLGDVWVSDGGTVTLNALLTVNQSAADPTDAALLQLLTDAQTARDQAAASASAAASSAASIDPETLVRRANNLSDLASAATARGNLGLGAAATRGVGTSSGDLLEVGALGSNFHFGNAIDFNALPGLYPYSGLVPEMSVDGSINGPPSGVYYHTFQVFHEGGNLCQIAYPYLPGSSIFFRNFFEGDWSAWALILSSRSTAVDSNGFIKEASPIVNLYAEKADIGDSKETEATQYQKLSTGKYQLKNCPPLATEGWYIEQPKDRNNNVYHNIEWSYGADNRELLIETFQRVWNPATGQYDNGAPVDIEAGRFVALRFEPDPSLYPDPEDLEEGSKDPAEATSDE